MIEQDGTVYETRLEDGNYRAKLVKECISPGPQFKGDPEAFYRRVGELFLTSSQFDVLFADDTKGDLIAFTRLFMDPSSTWLELAKDGEDVPIGLVYVTNVMIGFDAEAHFTLWDSKGKGREPLIKGAMAWAFDRYDLVRMTARVPTYQQGVIRFIERLGFKQEGKHPNSVLHKGKWRPLCSFGFLLEQLEGGSVNGQLN